MIGAGVVSLAFISWFVVAERRMYWKLDRNIDRCVILIQKMDNIISAIAVKSEDQS